MRGNPISPVQLHHKSCVSLVDIVSSEDSLRSSRNSVQALLESRYCIPSTLFNSLHMHFHLYPAVQMIMVHQYPPGKEKFPTRTFKSIKLGDEIRREALHLSPCHEQEQKSPCSKERKSDDVSTRFLFAVLVQLFQTQQYLNTTAAL